MTKTIKKFLTEPTKNLKSTYQLALASVLVNINGSAKCKAAFGNKVINRRNTAAYTVRKLENAAEACFRTLGQCAQTLFFPLDERPFYCSLRMFKDTTMDTFRNHVTNYRRRKFMADSRRIVDQHQCLMQFKQL
ncbi:hypothetical protein ACF0H5_001330 [Mactra antiquata]